MGLAAGAGGGVAFVPVSSSFSWTDASTFAKVTESLLEELVKALKMFTIPAPDSSEMELILLISSVWALNSELFAYVIVVAVPFFLTRVGLPSKTPLS